MAEKLFPDRLYDAVKDKKSVLCVGIDPQLVRMPRSLTTDNLARCSSGDMTGWALRDFVRDIIYAVRHHAVAVKFNTAFFLEHGKTGIEALEYGHGTARKLDFIVVNDPKCDDGDDTAVAHAEGHIGLVTTVAEDGTLVKKPSPIGADAVTVEPRLGDNCLEPFIDAVKDGGKGVFVFVRTSFKKRGGIEDLILADGSFVWQHWARKTIGWANQVPVGRSGYCGVGAVVGANNPADARWIRELLPESWFLVPGVGAQGADYDSAVAGADDQGVGVLVNSGRSIVFAGVRGNEETLTRKEWLAAVERAARSTKDGLNAALARARKPL